MSRVLKQKNRNRAFGITVVLIAMIFVIGGYRSDLLPEWKKTNGYQLNAEIDSAEGLRVGSKILLSGVPIGEIQDIYLNPTNAKAKLNLRIYQNIALPLDTSASIISNGLFGDKYVRLTAGGSPENLQHQDSLFYVESPIDFKKFLHRLISHAESLQNRQNQTQ